MDILQNQSLEVDVIMTLRVQAQQKDLQPKVTALLEYIKQQSAQKVGNAITTTYSIDPKTKEIDIQFYFPIDKKIPSHDSFIYKDKLKLVNCVKVNHKGNPNSLQQTCVKLNEYIAENKLIPISSGYNVTLYEVLKQEDIDKFNVDVYVSVSPNVV